jgi:diaminohydroxyphosphoribosylaminopyrimidine deaminase / 5-amino-6-(5-phosphoribosylamino)uracil reductase
MSNEDRDKYFLRRCIELAQCGLGTTYPNPMVGSVVVYDDRIVGEGFHIKSGEAHAEVNAINSVKNKSFLSKSTIYVSLEPCSHFGKTPPCADLIIQQNIPRIVIGSLDVNPLVSGKGEAKLITAGREVHSGLLQNECNWLNRRFIKYYTKKRPYVILKWAQTLDGFIDKQRDPSVEKPAWITNERCRSLVHKWRTEEQAIMIGTNTALKDNPTLNARAWNGNNPLRITLDRTMRLPQSLTIFQGNQPTLVYTARSYQSSSGNTTNIAIDFNNHPLQQILDDLFNKNIQSLIVEGGSTLLESFIKAGLWDEARIFTGSQRFGNGVQAPSIKGECFSLDTIQNTTLSVLVNRNS